jgi:hypothetical protein
MWMKDSKKIDTNAVSHEKNLKVAEKYFAESKEI